MRIAYDTEFLERGPDFPIHLISIGMVREDGAELYYVNSQAPWDDVYANVWLRENVLPYLPRNDDRPDTFRPDTTSELVVPRNFIMRQVMQFCAEGLAAGERAELWACYADYDHVVLSQLFGRMVDLPPYMPMYTRDIKQEADRLRLELPPKEGDEHHALADARWNATALRAIDEAGRS